MEPLIKTEPSISYTIFIAGDYDKAVAISQEYCNQEGFCVTVTPTKYVYSFGQESGVIIGIINYPRFPKTLMQLRKNAIDLANLLRTELNQESFTIYGPEKTEWFSYREQDIKNNET